MVSRKKKGPEFEARSLHSWVHVGIKTAAFILVNEIRFNQYGLGFFESFGCPSQDLELRALNVNFNKIDSWPILNERI